MLREDILVSVCVHDIAPMAEGATTLRHIAHELEGTFRYWELLVAIPPDVELEWYEAFQAVPNLRLLRLRPGLGTYGVREVLAAQAIGDVVAIASASEVEFLDLKQMILDASRGNTMVIADRGRASFLDTILAMAANSSGFRVNARFMQTMAFPRGLLTRLMNQPERQLALRFPPRDSAIPLQVHAARAAFRTHARGAGPAGRLVLAQRLIVSSAPSVLMALSLASTLVALGGFLFLIYVIATWFLNSSVQPGWATTSGILAVSAGFLGLLGLGLSTGMQKIIDLLAHKENDDVLEELGKINVYAGISEDLNVHYERGTGSELPAEVVHGRLQ